jgi:hypothetical protein
MKEGRVYIKGRRKGRKKEMHKERKEGRKEGEVTKVMEGREVEEGRKNIE